MVGKMHFVSGLLALFAVAGLAAGDLTHLEALQREALAEASEANLHKFEDDNFAPFKLSAEDEAAIQSVNDENAELVAEMPDKVRALWKMRIAEHLLWSAITEYRQLIGEEGYDVTHPTDSPQTVRVKRLHGDILVAHAEVAVWINNTRTGDAKLKALWPQIRAVDFTHAEDFLSEHSNAIKSLEKTEI